MDDDRVAAAPAVETSACGDSWQNRSTLSEAESGICPAHGSLTGRKNLSFRIFRLWGADSHMQQ